jgi:hypothetical protein
MSCWWSLPILETNNDIVSPVVDCPIRICALDELPKIDSAEETHTSFVASSLNRDRERQHDVKLG